MKVNDIIALTEKLHHSTTWNKYKENPFDSDTKVVVDAAKKGIKKLAGKIKAKVTGKK